MRSSMPDLHLHLEMHHLYVPLFIIRNFLPYRLPYQRHFSLRKQHPNLQDLYFSMPILLAYSK